MRRARRRTLAIALSTIVAFALLGAAVFLRMHAAPEPARLLPECNGILYANLKPVRTFTNLGQRPGAWKLESRDFLEQTGFEAERDLDEIAFAIHASQDPGTESRYSEVMVGHFNSAQINTYLTRMAGTRENYRDHEIFLIPSEDRTVRVTLLSPDMVAASNTGDPAQIRHIIDEFSRSAFAFSGPRLLARYYRDVPFSSLAWLITEIPLPKSLALGDAFNPMPLVQQLFGGGVLVASARYNGNLLLRADDLLQGQALTNRADQLQNLLTLYRTTEQQTRPDHPDPELESALESLKADKKSDRVQITMSIPRPLLERMFAKQSEAAEIPQPQPAPSKSKKESSRQHPH
jgi:hypothetical protein